MATKTEGSLKYPREAYAYAPDPDKPSEWKLRLWESPTKKETATQIGRTVAALSAGGFRGNRVQLPTDAAARVKRKVLAAWRRTHPNAKLEDEPNVLKGATMDLETLTAKVDQLEGQHAEIIKRAERAEAVVDHEIDGGGEKIF